MKNLFVRLCKIALAAYLAICLLLFWFQRSLLYFPTPTDATAARSDLHLDTGEASLRVSVRAKKRPRAVIYFGGNAEDVSYALPDFARAFPEHALYLMHYRGYSGSTGQPSETALHADAEQLFETVAAQHSQITLIGRSLGSGVAVRLASQRKEVEHLILITPYDSILNLAQRKFPLIPVSLLMLDRFESWRYAPLVEAPTLVLAAEDDQVVPLPSTLALYRAFPAGVATMRVIAGVGHNTISDSIEYHEALSASATENASAKEEPSALSASSAVK